MRLPMLSLSMAIGTFLSIGPHKVVGYYRQVLHIATLFLDGAALCEGGMGILRRFFALIA